MIENQRVIAEVNLDCIAENIKNIRKNVKKETEIMAVVKADGYGHGMIEIAKTCIKNGANWLGVAIFEEALELRKNNITLPILILGNTFECAFEYIIKKNITQTVFSFNMAKKLSEVATKLKKNANIHIKIDTGMSRIGFFPNDEGISSILNINKLPYIKITGVFTHFSQADAKDKSFTKEQFEKYNFVIERLKQNGLYKITKHVSNSGAILDLDELNLNMVRAGIIIYGLYPSDDVRKKIQLLPAMKIKSKVSFLKEIEKDTGVSYCQTFLAKKKTKIATIPVGYADGYTRIMSNKGKVIINGKYANIVGNICMDQFMVDVTHIEDIKEGDTVILLGQDKNLNISAEDLAKLQNTINYEIVCGVGKRVPRVYIENGKAIKLKSSFEKF